MNPLSTIDVMGTRALCSIAAMAGILFSTVATSAESTGVEELDTLLSQYENYVETSISPKFDAKLGTLKKNYSQALERAQQDAQSSGNLKEALVMKQEIAAIAQDSDSPAEIESYPTLTRMKEVFESEKAKLQEEKKTALQPTVKKLISQFDILIADLTKAGRVPDAMTVKARKETFFEKEVKIPVLERGKLEIKINVPHYGEIKIRGNKIWYDHTNGQGALPGMRTEALPTFVDGEEWVPVWTGMTTDQYRLPFSLPLKEFDIRASVAHGRAEVKVVATPSKENDFTATIGFLDTQAAADWSEFRISW